MVAVDRYDEGGEKAIYRDAWRIADPGASNPVAVARTLFEASSWLLHQIGTDEVEAHPALRVMAGQLAFLYGVSALGADIEDYDKVKSYVDKSYVDNLNKAEDLTEKS